MTKRMPTEKLDSQQHNGMDRTSDEIIVRLTRQKCPCPSGRRRSQNDGVTTFQSINYSYAKKEKEKV